MSNRVSESTYISRLSSQAVPVLSVQKKQADRRFYPLFQNSLRKPANPSGPVPDDQTRLNSLKSKPRLKQPPSAFHPPDQGIPPAGIADHCIAIFLQLEDVQRQRLVHAWSMLKDSLTLFASGH